MKPNRAWHDHNKMPFRPTMEARVQWHLEHAKACACRAIPKGVLEAMETMGIKPPKPAAS